MRQDADALNLEQVMAVLRRRVPWIVLCVVVVAAAAFVFSKQETKKYTATASLAFSDNPLSQQIAGLSSSSGSVTSLLAQQANDVELVRLGDMATKTALLLGHGLTPDKVSESVSVAGQGESGVVDVTATATSPELVAEIANTYTQQFVSEQQRSNSQYFKSALALVHKQLAALSPQQRVGSDGLSLQDREQSLVLLSELKYGNVQIAQEAVAPIAPSSPKPSRNTAIGGFLGLLIGLALAFLLEPLNRRIRGPEELAKIYRLPVLGAVPESSALSRAARDNDVQRTALPTTESEAFSLIRAHLRFFNIDRDLKTVLIASAEPGDGKTTIARHMAEAATRLGSQVLLLEADLRHPTLAQQLGIQPGPGLADVLIGAAEMRAAIQSVALEASPSDGASGRRLEVLAAGAVLPPNPGELLESQAMSALLEQARYAYDFVVIDTPPLAAVSDAFPLLTEVDGVVIVGRAGHSRRDAAGRLHQVLASSGAPLLGVIANGSKSGAPTPYPGAGRASSAATSDNGASPSADEPVSAVKV
jgi:capsular exopolysaccharide synthesis family protein